MKRNFTAFRFSDTDKNTVVTTRTVRPPWMRRVIIGEAVALVALSLTFGVLAALLSRKPQVVVQTETRLVMPKPATVTVDRYIIEGFKPHHPKPKKRCPLYPDCGVWPIPDPTK